MSLHYFLLYSLLIPESLSYFVTIQLHQNLSQNRDGELAYRTGLRQIPVKAWGRSPPDFPQRAMPCIASRGKLNSYHFFSFAFRPCRLCRLFRLFCLSADLPCTGQSRQHIG